MRPLRHLLVVCTLIATVAGCGGSGSGGAQSSGFAGARVSPPRPSPSLALQDSLGRRVDLREFRGRAVLVTFIYTHCPDICPLIVGNLHNAQAALGSQASKVQIVAVSTDPRGDNPRTVATFLKAHEMTGRMEYLLGSQKQLQKVWADWQIIATPSPTGRDRVEHSAMIYGISAGGKLTTVYPPTFTPAQIVHDVPLLASQ